MSLTTFSIISLIFLFTLMGHTESLDYDDLIETGKYCSKRDQCEGYRKRLTYKDRNCECDAECVSYKDCCIDAGGPGRRPLKPPRRSEKCVPFGLKKYSGVYMLAECSRNWTGSSLVREKCVGPLDLSDPLNATPVTSVNGKTSYRNIFCAQCNNANMDSLKLHQLRFGCEGLQNVTQEQILEDLTYNEANGTWGVYRRDSQGNRFIGCEIVFDVPSYLNSSVRFCRPDVVSTCASDWTSPRIKRNCLEYMAVIYDRNNVPYRNPHCAICNHKTPESLFCYPSDMDRTTPFSVTFLINVYPNQGSESDRLQVSPACLSNQIYDPFFKRCKRLICAMDGERLVNGRCVEG